jgi:glycosyltransferase involved in cell wall biosynthesis
MNLQKASELTQLAGSSRQYRGVWYEDCEKEALLGSILRPFEGSWDIVFSVGSPRVLMMTYRVPRIKLRVLTVHTAPAASPYHGIETERIRSMNRYADFIICVSEAIGSFLVERGIRAEKIQVMYNGVDSAVFYPRPLSRRTHRLVFAGALVPIKGIDILLKAFLRVKEVISDAELVICGSADMYGRQQLQIDHSLMPQDGSVHFTGKLTQSQLAQEFSQAGLAVVPSSANRCIEGFGMVSVEAQACGCPVIVSRNGGLPETIIEGITGKVCSADNPGALAEMIAELLADASRLRLMGEQAIKHVRQKFLWDETLKPLKNLVENKVTSHSVHHSLQYLKRCGQLTLHRIIPFI